MIKLTNIEQALYDEGVAICTRRSRDAALLIANLQKNQRTNLYKKFGWPSLFQFAIHEYKLSEAEAYCFISVARRASESPVLHEAIQNQRLSVSKASRIVSALKKDNAAELVEFAIKNSQAKIDREVARINPKARSRDKVKWLSEDEVELTITVSKKGFEDLNRAESIAAQKGKKFSGRGEVVELSLAEFVERHDPVQKAARANKKRLSDDAKSAAASEQHAGIANKTTSQLCENRVVKSARVKPTAEQLHVINYRDQGQCTHVNIHGERCNSDRYVEIHHIIPVSNGGGNDPSNLTTLCGFHHDLVHQLSFPIDNQVTWLRSPTVEYRCR